MYNFENVSVLGETTTSVTDLSSFKNNITLKNGATYNSSGKFRNALILD